MVVWALIPAVKADSLGSFTFHITLILVTQRWALVPAVKAESFGSFFLDILYVQGPKLSRGAISLGQSNKTNQTRISNLMALL